MPARLSILCSVARFSWFSPPGCHFYWRIGLILLRSDNWVVDRRLQSNFRIAIDNADSSYLGSTYIGPVERNCVDRAACIRRQPGVKHSGLRVGLIGKYHLSDDDIRFGPWRVIVKRYP